MTHADWRKLLEEHPEDRPLRLAYADWLEERGAEWDEMLAERPEDRPLRLAYADWLERQGQRARAEAVRWYLDEQMRPRRAGQTGSSYCWWSHDVWPGSSWDPEDVPGAIYAFLEGWEPDEQPNEFTEGRRWYESRFAAEKALLDAYVRCQEAGTEFEPRGRPPGWSD